MGQRANLIVVQDRTYTLYYSHWCANTIPRDLFWGPAHAIDFILCQREVDESGWLDNVWAEGAAVVDCDKDVLLLYGGEDVLFDVPLRREYLKMLRRVWRGWQVHWAYEGIADIADYVGYPRSKVLDKDRPHSECSLDPPQERDWTDAVGSVRQADGILQLFPLAGNVEYYLNAGPMVVGEPNHPNALATLPLDEWIKDGFPRGGFHVDVALKTVDFWIAKDAPNVVDRVSRAWCGWDINWRRDDFEFQLQVTGGRLRFPARPADMLKKRLRDMLLCDYGYSPIKMLLDLTEREKRKGQDVQINPLALRDDRIELSKDERLRILAIALGE